ncbi:protease inhibitor I42 family protein [Streptomyces silvensis]|uniref:protease inhibitor I42 family protein n=1 Tax=Streptomyces silvensis TaxID=1765722 RepID=UPI000ADF5EC9
MPQVTCTEADDGRDIHVRVGDSVAVTLPENPTTGHLWLIASEASAVLVAQGSRFSPGAGAAPGASGARTFTFRAQVAGVGLLKLHLCRPWRTTAAPLASFSLTVHSRKRARDVIPGRGRCRSRNRGIAEPPGDVTGRA